MSAFILVDITVKCPEAYREYLEKVPPLVAKHGGRYLVRGGEHQILEGDWVPSRLVIVEFPNREAALAFYRDPDYQPVKAIRTRTTDSRMIIVEGVMDGGDRYDPGG